MIAPGLVRAQGGERSHPGGRAGGQGGSINRHSLSGKHGIESLKTFIPFHPVIAFLGIYHKKIREAHQSIIDNNEKLKT